jgi:hypothetical protein
MGGDHLWEAIGAIGETLSAIAVLITIGYLAVQIRQNTQAMKTSALRSVQDVVLLTEKNERYIGMLMKAQRSEKLSPEERAHLVERFLTIMRTFERIWQEHKLGAVSQDQFEQHLDLLRWALSMPEPCRMWEYMAQTFDPDFRAIVDAKVLADDAPTSSMVKAFLALDG